MLKINGQEVQDAVGKTLSAWLEESGYKIQYLAVECNGEIVPKSQYDAKILADGDSLEVVSFVGGG
jgi:sulfur carrier protein